MSKVMKASDTISAKQAECYITIEGKRYKFMQALNVEAKIEKIKVEVPILGQTAKGNKSVGWKGTGSATFHYNTSIFRELLQRFNETGEDVYFDMQISNYDESSKAGRQTIILIGCNLNGGVLAKFGADTDILEDSVEFTFEDFKMPESFKILDGMM